MPQKNKSIFFFLCISIAIMNIFMVALLVYTLETSRERKAAEVGTTVENFALLLDKSVTGTSKEIGLSLHEVQAYLEKELRKKGQLDTKEINDFIREQEKWIQSIAEIRITDAQGQVRYGRGIFENSHFHYRDYDFFIAAQHDVSDQLHVSKLIRDPTTSSWIHVFSRRYNDSNGQFAGVITAALPASYFYTLISDLKVGAKGVVIVQDLDFTVIARHPTLSTANGKVGFVGASPELIRLVNSGAQSGTIYTRQTTDKVPRIGNFRRLTTMPIFVAVAFGEEDYLAQWYDDITKAVFLEFLFLLVTTTAGWLLWRQIKASVLANQRSQMLLRNAHDGIHVLDLQGRLLEASDSFYRMIGHSPAEVIGKSPSYWDAGYSQDEIQELIHKSIHRLEGMRFETFYQNAQGERYPVEVTSVLIKLDDYQVFFCSARDLTERKKAEEDQRIAATAFESQVGMLITDHSLVILRTNRAFSEITGYSQQELVGHTPHLLQSGMHDKNFYATMWDQIRTTGSWQGELWNKRKNGELYPQHISIASVQDQHGQITHYVATITDISAYKASEEKVRILAFYDSLTKLPNRRLFLEHLEQSIQQAQKQQHKGAVLCVDLDNFKALNDTEGHNTGDLLLQQVATRLIDCVGPDNRVARLGSDEFVILLDHLDHSEAKAIQQAEITAKGILKALAQPYFLDTSEYRSSASMGISLFGLQQHECVQETLKRADMAMSEAKTIGRNNLRFFDPQIQSQIQERAELEAGLRIALEQHQLILYYQPQVNGARQITGFEALVRWQHPSRGMISPARFIPVAEENGLIVPLGSWVLETACQQLSQWAKHAQTAHLSIAVNVSAKQFAQPDFVKDMLSILHRTAAPAHLLKLELTESALVMQVEDIIEKMVVLKRHGVTFSLDDFGTGYSSLTYLKRIPIDQLKIDQSFVRDILVNTNDAEIAKMIIVLAKTLGISVLAEGIETEAQRDLLEKQGCYHYQGYLFGKPMPIEILEQYLLSQQTQRNVLKTYL